MHMLSYPAAWYLNEGLQTKREPRSAHPFIVPSQLYRTHDGWIFSWRRTSASGTAVRQARRARTLKADSRLRARACTRDDADATSRRGIRQANDRGVARDLRDRSLRPVYDSRRARQPYFLRAGRRPGLRSSRQTGLQAGREPFRIGENLPARPAPKLGEHTDALLRELGYGDEDIAQLKKSGAV
jgi:crotonobetainyl-CoA:carnitine CoA-transferase CaiB-like acyl-CoA transferase